MKIGRIKTSKRHHQLSQMFAGGYLYESYCDVLLLEFSSFIFFSMVNAEAAYVMEVKTLSSRR